MSILILLCILFPLISAFLCLALHNRKNFQGYFVIISCFIVLVLTLLPAIISNNNAITVHFLKLSFSYGNFQTVYAVITAFLWTAAALVSPEYFKGGKRNTRYYFFFMLTLCATEGVFLSTDLITTYIFFEIMSFSSYLWIIHNHSNEALEAGKTYHSVAILSGVVALIGLFVLYNVTGTLVIDEIYQAVTSTGKSKQVYVAAFCLLIGFGAKSGLFPFHNWLPQAHPVAPSPASSLLSGILTKTGIFGILVVTSRILVNDKAWGYVLLVVACINMIIGAVLAVISTNLKKTLACSSLSQIGLMTVGISMISLMGDNNMLAANGTFLYMVNHSFVKLVLFLCAGAICSGAQTLNLDKLRGYGRNKPIIMIPFLIGASSLSGIPGFVGYISKALIHESIVHYAVDSGIIITIIEILFLITGGLTIAYMLKLFITIFIEKPTEDTPKYKNPTMLSSFSLFISALPLIVIGILPYSLASRISSYMTPFINAQAIDSSIQYFSFEYIKGFLISLIIGIVVYLIVIRLIIPKHNRKSLDLAEY